MRPTPTSLFETERFLGAARAAGAVLAMLQFVVFSRAEQDVRSAGLGLTIGVALLAATTLWRVRAGDAPGSWLRRFGQVTFGIDALLLVGFNLLLAFEEGATTRGLLLLVVLEGAMKFRGPAAWSAFGVIAGAEAARAALRVGVHGLPVGVEEAVFFLGLALLVTLFAVKLAEVAAGARVGRAVATRQAALARRDVDALNEVLVHGLQSITDEEVGVVLRCAGEAVGFGEILACLVEDGSLTPVAYTGSSQRPIVVEVPDTGGAIDAVLHGDAGPVRGGRGDDIAIVVGFATEGLNGLLVLRTPTRAERASDAMLRSLANQVGLVLHARIALRRQAILNEELRRADRVKQEFITVASHELRTPLTTILASAELLVDHDEQLGSRRGEIARVISRQAGRLAEMVGDFERLLELDNDRLTLEMVPVPVGGHVAAAANRCDAPVDVSLVRSERVLADPLVLADILDRLLANAVEHAAGQGVRISVGRNGDHVEIVVHDEGPGVPDELHDLIFRRFTQGADIMAHQRGTGLGLPIARELARRCGGDLRLAPSTVGASFVLTLPAVARSEDGLSEVGGLGLATAVDVTASGLRRV